jgi:signal transduction histidine kinase
MVGTADVELETAHGHCPLVRYTSDLVGLLKRRSQTYASVSDDRPWFARMIAGKILRRALGLPGWWRSLDAGEKLATGASAFTFCAMAYLGVIVTHHIREAMINRSLVEAALYLDNLVQPRVQELARSRSLSAETRVNLEKLLSPASMQRPVVAFRVWIGDTIVFSSERAIIGKTFPPTANRSAANRGHPAADLGSPHGEEHDQIRSLNLPILETYAPIRETGTDRIIAVVETYEVAVELQEQIRIAQALAWLLTGAVIVISATLFFGMVRSRALERDTFLSRIADLASGHAESERLRKRANSANRRMGEINERHLRCVGNELYEGPVQHVGLALLKLDLLQRPGLDTDDLELIRTSLTRALNEMRTVSAGVFPVGMEKRSLAEIIVMAARRHRRRTGVEVKCEIGELPEKLPFLLKACLYRHALEALGCASLMSPGDAPALRVGAAGKAIELEILGRAPRLDEDTELGEEYKLTLLRLSDRIEAMGGTFEVRDIPSGDVATLARFTLDDWEVLDGE